MSETAELLLALGGFLLLGLMADHIGRRTFLPRVTLLLACGVVAGDGILGLIPDALSDRFEIITNVALMMIGFLLGGKLSGGLLRTRGRQVLLVSLLAALAATALVTLSLVLLGVQPEVALLLGCIAAATAPAATVDTVLEYGGNSRFAETLLAIVAIDDVWALVLFSLGLAAVKIVNGVGGDASPLLHAAVNVLGALLLGAVIGLPAAVLTGRVRLGRPMLLEALGLVLACGGLALWLNVSFLIATMVMGAVIANRARHHEHPFHEIENIEQPFLVVFFILAGASLELSVLRELSLLGLVYVLARGAGKVLGALAGGALSRADADVRRWMGVALLPQAGVAIGMALLAASIFPNYRNLILPVVISTTVVFELIGPVCTRWALRRTGSEADEIPAGPELSASLQTPRKK